MVKAAIGHQETERAPYCMTFTPDGEKRLQTLIGPRSAKDFVDNDVIQIWPPWWGWNDLGTEWREPEFPTSRERVTGVGSYEKFADTLKLLRDNSDKYILAMIYCSHFEKANSARSIENFLADMAGEKETSRKFLNRLIDRNMVMLENFLCAPEIDGVLLGSDWGSQRDLLMSPAVWQDLIRPGEQREYDLVHGYGKDVWIHSCGNIEKVIPSLVEMGMDVLNPVQPEAMDIAALKEKFGARLSFWGGISTQQALPFGTPDEVKREARRVRDIMGRNGGYILSPSQEIQGDVPAENVLALLEVARERRS